MLTIPVSCFSLLESAFKNTVITSFLPILEEIQHWRTEILNWKPVCVRWKSYPNSFCTRLLFPKFLPAHRQNQRDSISYSSVQGEVPRMNWGCPLIHGLFEKLTTPQQLTVLLEVSFVDRNGDMS